MLRKSEPWHNFFGKKHVFLGVQSSHDFRHAWHVFRIRLVVSWVVRINHDTILPIVTRFWLLQTVIQVFLIRFWRRAWRERNLDYKGALGLSVFVVRFSKNIVNTLGSEISPLEGSKSFLLCFLLGFIVSNSKIKGLLTIFHNPLKKTFETNIYIRIYEKWK